MKIADALKKTLIVQQDLNLYRLDSTHFPIDMAELKNSIAQYTGFEILIRRTSWKADQIRGRILREEPPGKKLALIDVSEDMSECWQRFSATKEMCHLIIDTDDSMVGSSEKAEKLVSDLIEIKGQSSDGTNHSLDSEFIAVACAMELLFPLHERSCAAKMLKSGSSYYAVASRYMIPEYYVEKVFTEKYQRETDALVNQILSEIEAAA